MHGHRQAHSTYNHRSKWLSRRSRVPKFFITSALSERCFESWCPLPNVKSVTQAISTRPSMYSTMSFMRVGCSLLISSQPSISRSRLPYCRVVEVMKTEVPKENVTNNQTNWSFGWPKRPKLSQNDKDHYITRKETESIGLVLVLWSLGHLVSITSRLGA